MSLFFSPPLHSLRTFFYCAEEAEAASEGEDSSYKQKVNWISFAKVVDGNPSTYPPPPPPLFALKYIEHPILLTPLINIQHAAVTNTMLRLITKI